MRRRVLLISANRCTTPDAVFPLGLAHLSAALRQAGHEIAWLDALTGLDRLGDVLSTWRPDYIGISLRNIDDVLIGRQETFFGEVASLSATLRQQTRVPIILGGSGFSIFPEQLLRLTGADYGICGEGEAGLVALLAALENGGELSRVPGLLFWQNGAIRVNAASAGTFEAELSEADRPAAITAHYLGTGGMLNVQTQRGCGFRCSYCTYPLIEGRRHRVRPPELVAAEFEQLERLGARYVFIVDSVFNSSPRHVTEVCEAILERRVKLSWGCFLRPQGLTADLLKLMARAGLAHIEFGSDSFCDEVLAACQKDFTFDDIVQASEAAWEANVDFCHFLISGGPGETRETLEHGFRNSQRLKAGAIMALVGMRIYPGTALFERAVAEGRIRRDAELLAPTYYLAPGLTQEEVFAQIRRFAQFSPNWIVGDPTPAYHSLVERLRRRGVLGPLWTYFAMLQRIRPQAAAAPRS
ncbi:MAG TPA: lipid biosynthesis B12-binding/radical SAM protein [Dongiaceae bacterium]|nr:lipid biosynthesis B12-binding/radical SAM protein [Dongiaceae bacterium]